jgi:hypothetical protein
MAPCQVEISYSGARRFWRPFVTGGKVRVAIGGPALEGNSWEESGLIGVGDALALRDLQAAFAGIGAAIDIRLAPHTARSELADRPLVSLGGPDSSHVTKTLMEHAETTLRFGDPDYHEVTISDLMTGRHFSPQIRSQTGEDYGLIVRLPGSEMMYHAAAVVIGGSFGYGTWAGARLVREKQFLGNPIVRSKSPFECLYRTEVVDGHLGGIEILALRLLGGGIRPLSGGRGSVWLGPRGRGPSPST